jgi:PHP family Zn ribbon phosphoesterase
VRIPVDLHIHSALSPCADASMTPGDIVGMASLKGLAVIAVTDHQSCGNLAIVDHFAREAGIVSVPGMELETSEEVHLVCLFPDIPTALAFEREVRASMPDRPNRPEIFGPQILFDLDNEPCGQEPRLLLIASGIGVDAAFQRVAELGGVVVPAHVDRESNSLLATLGAVPPDLPLRWVEISAGCDESGLLLRHPALAAFGRLRSSDAHRLGEILEPCMLLDVDASSSGKTDIFMVLESLRPEKRR